MAVTTSQVQQLYIAYFNRPADFFGLTFQTAQANQFGLQFVADQFSKSPEYLSTYAGKGIGDVVDTIYMNLFGRHAEPAGLKFWGDLLSDPKSGVTIGNAAITIANGAINDDKVSVANKLTAANAFYASLDTSAKIIGYSGDAANAVVKAWMTGITTQATLDASITPAALLTVETAAGAAHDASTSTTFTLTNGVDTLVGTAGNDIFNTTVGVGATLTAFDTIDGGTGSNTLNIVNATITPTIDTTAIAGLSVKNIQTVNVQGASTVLVDSTAWTGVTKLNVLSSTGADTITSANTTAVNVNDSVGDVTVNGGAAITVATKGNITAGGTSLAATINGAVASATQASDISAAAAAVVAHTAATTHVTNLSTLNTAISGAGTTLATVTAATAAAVTSGDITAAQKTSIDAAATNGAVTDAGHIAAAIALVTPLQATAVSAQTAAATADTNGAALVAADTASGNYNVIDTANTGLTSASVKGNYAGLTTITDASTASNTLTSVSLDNAGAATLTGKALSTVSVANSTHNVTIVNAATGGHALALSLNADTAGAVTDATATSVAVTTSGAASTGVTLNAAAATAVTISSGVALTLAALNGAAATSLAVSGAGATTISAFGTAGVLKTVTIAGAGGLTADLSGQTVLTSVDASASSGANKIALNDTVAGYIGGSGVDTVKVTGVAAFTVDGGAGSADVINLAGNGGTILTAATGAKFVNFEVLDATGGTGIFDASLISGIAALQTGADTGAVSFINVAAGESLSILADTGFAVSYALKTDTAADSLTMNLGTSKTAGFAVTSGVSIGAIETVNIVSNGTVTTAGVSTGTNAVALTDAAVTKLAVSGAESLTLTGLTGGTVTSVDATGMAKGATFTLTTAATATAGATVTAGDANLVFTGSAAATKVDTITAGNGNNTIVDAAGNDVVTLGNGTNTVTLAGAGNHIVVVGTGVNTVTVGAGQDVITFGAHAATNVDTLNVGIASSANTYSTVTGLQHGDILNLGAGNGTAVFAGGTAAAAHIVLNASTALFADYIQAATSAATGTANSIVSWFQFGGNTYVVEDNSNATAYAAGTDNVVKLVGTFDLSTAGSVSTIVANHIVL